MLIILSYSAPVPMASWEYVYSTHSSPHKAECIRLYSIVNRKNANAPPKSSFARFLCQKFAILLITFTSLFFVKEPGCQQEHARPPLACKESFATQAFNPFFSILKSLNAFQPIFTILGILIELAPP